MNEKLIFDISNIVNDLKKLLDGFIERFSNIERKGESINKVVKKFTNDNEFLKKLDFINTLSDNLLDKLEALNDFKEEYNAFLSIKNMLNYIIEDIKRYILFCSFVNDLISSFYNIIEIKINLIKNGNREDYENFFKIFDEKLFNQEEFFYLNIYRNTHQHDDLIAEVTNVLW